MSTQKFPSAWTNAGVAGRAASVTASTPVEAHWWDDMSDSSKEEYVAEHPNSKYADMHKEAKEKQLAPGKPKADDKPAAPKHTPEPESHKPADPEHAKKSSAAHESLKSDELQPKSPMRSKIANYIKSRPAAMWGHLKHEGQEFKTAGKALAGMARGKPLDAHGKKALASVAADLATITFVLVTGGHAAHGLAAFFAHGGTHLAQDCLIKSAVKGAIHHAAYNPFTAATADGEDMKAIVERAVAMMAQVIESGDLKKYVDEADKEGGESTPATAKITARIDMSADVAGKGLCPECRKPMSVVTSGASKMWACASDRISFPVPNGYNA